MILMVHFILEKQEEQDEHQISEDNVKGCSSGNAYNETSHHT